MYCPDGFLTLPEVKDRLGPKWASPEFRSQPLRFAGNSIIDLAENWLFSEIVDRSDIHLCSPNGQLLRWVDDGIFDKVSWDDFGGVTIIDELARAEFGLRKPMLDNVSGHEFHGTADRDEQPWPTLPLYFLRRSYTVSLDGYRLLRDRVLGHLSYEERVEQTGLGFERETTWKILEQFEGWSICVRKNDFPERSQPHSEPSVGARSEAQVARNIVEAWKAGKIRNKSDAYDLLGLGITKRKFFLAWARAAETLPEISRPGRKPGAPSEPNS